MDFKKLNDLKFVKKAFLKNQDDKIIIQHYQIDIFIYDPITKKAIDDLNCSNTSNRMIKRAIEFFNVKSENIKDIHIGSKWNYSRPL